MTANIFISFASKDVKMAMTLCTALENRGYKCWISARDIQPGENFQVAIVQAIRHAKILLLVFTANSNNSEEMTKELALASQQKMIVIPLRVEDVTPSDAFAYEFATRQWIDFFADWEFAIEQLARRIANALRERSAGLETNDATEALSSLAGIAPVAYNLDGPPKAPEVPAVKAPEPPKVEAPKAPEPVKAAPIEAKIVEPPKPVTPPEPIKPPAAAKPIAESSAVEVREEVLAALKPAAKPASPAAPTAKAEPARTPPAKPPEPAKAKPAAETDAPPGGNRRVMVLIGVAVLALIGIGLAVPAIMRASKPAAPAEAEAPPLPEPTVVAIPAAEPAINAVAVTAPATNTVAAVTPLPSSAATNAPAAPKPRRKVETVKSAKDDIPF